MAESEMLSRSEQLVAKLIANQKDIENRFFFFPIVQHTQNSSDNKQKQHTPEIPQDAWAVLEFVFDNEFAYQKQITDGVRISGDKIMKIKKILIQRGLIRTVKFAVVDYPQVHYILTAKALQIFGTMKKDKKKIGYWKFLCKTHPGYEHRLFQHVLNSLHRKKLGWEATVEKILPDKRRVDLYCIDPHSKHRKAIEIETSTKDLENKIRVLDDDHADELVLLYSNETGVTYAQSKIDAILEKTKIARDRIWIGLAREYVKIMIGIVKHSEKVRNTPKQTESVPEDDPNPKRFRNSSEMTKEDKNN